MATRTFSVSSLQCAPKASTQPGPEPENMRQAQRPRMCNIAIGIQGFNELTELYWISPGTPACPGCQPYRQIPAHGR